jgi:hypothetical protein
MGMITRPAMVNPPIMIGTGFPPPAIGVLMRTTDEIEEELLQLSFEMPQPCALSLNITKERLENLCVRRFLVDARRADHTIRWELIGRGGDPPDFKVSCPAGELGLELTQLTSSSRRRGHAEFRRVRARLLEEGPEGFERIRGHMVYFWVIPDERPDGLAKQSEHAAIVEALRSYSPVPSPIADISKPMPDSFAFNGTGQATAWQFQATPWQGAPSALYSLMGFDIGLCIVSSHTARDSREEVARVIASHDRPGSDVLVIQVGAPDLNGFTYPTDAVIMKLGVPLLQARPVTTQYIDRVVIHYWADGSINDLPLLDAAA